MNGLDPYEELHRKVKSPLDKRPSPSFQANEKEPHAQDSIDEAEDAEPSTSLEILEERETLVSHLSDLQKQLIKGAGIFLFFLIGVFSTINLWLPYVTRGHPLIILGPLEVVKFYMSISTAIAFGLSLPFLCHFTWKFVQPGLTDKETRFLKLYSPVMLLLFLSGIAFGYFIVNPLSYSFLLSLGAVNFDIMVSAQEYMRFLLMTTTPIGLLFELPIVTLFLSAIGVLTAESMKKVRKWSYLVLAIVSALITPPDFISQLLVLIPMALLYEASIALVLMAERRKANALPPQTEMDV